MSDEDFDDLKLRTARFCAGLETDDQRRADMMSDRDFGELEIKAMIAPHSVKWPTHSLLWQRLHAVVDEARAREQSPCTDGRDRRQPAPFPRR